MALTRLAHQLIYRHVERYPAALNLAVDATCGNGHDTQFLAKLGFASVIATDIQAQAIEATRARLEKANITTVQLHQLSHAQLDSLIQSPVDCFMFNLGYLPHGDKNITTLAENTLAALNFASIHLSKNGIISLLCYPGHTQGRIETQHVQNWLEGNRTQWQIQQHLSSNANATSPILYTLTQS